MTNNTDDFLVDKFIRCVENRIVNEPNGSTYKIYEGTRGDWVAWASKQEPRVRLPYASRFCRLRLLLRGCKNAMSISEVKIDPSTLTHSNNFFLF